MPDGTDRFKFQSNIAGNLVLVTFFEGVPLWLTFRYERHLFDWAVDSDDYEEGHQYQVPRYIALELESIGAVWH